MTSVEQIAAEAARSAGCGRAAVFRWVNDRLMLVASSGGDHSFVVEIRNRKTRDQPLPGAIPLLDGQQSPCWLGDKELCFPSGPVPGFVVAVPIEGVSDHQGMLVLLNDRSGPFLNAAQCYVLRGLAAHLATLFEVEALRLLSIETGNPEYLAKIERLRLLESVAVNARDSILITEAQPIDLPGPRILYCNAAFTHTTGYTVADVLGKTPRILQGPKTDPETRKRLRTAFLAWESIEVELINYRKDGTPFWVELSIVPVADDDGWFTHWVSVQRDVTERKQAEELATRIRVAEVENRALENEIEERRRVEADLSYRAFHDSLTNLNNRAFFMHRLRTAHERMMSGRSTQFAILYLDLDQFKVVNDSLGHSAGDLMLQEVAERLRQCARPQDTLARIGGDEFALLIENTEDLSVPVMIAERIAAALQPPIQLGRQAIFPACSIGIVSSLGRTDDPEGLIRDADIAMYEAKRLEQAGYAIFDASMHADAVAMLALRTDLRLAVERNEFGIAYQPIVSSADGKVVGFEALLRWNHPERGHVSPMDFVPLAEKMGLIRHIDRWVMRTACEQLSAWHALGRNNDLRMSINTSVSEFTDPAFFYDLKAILDEFGLEPRVLELEITEGIFLHSSPTIASLIERFRALGVRIALDDFGTGYSSLSYINRYQIDTIKIDRSFVAGICSDARTRAVVELIAKLGESLAIETVAEGAETAQQAELARLLGCTFIQGFYYSMPLSPSDATAFLLAQPAVMELTD